MTKYLFLLASAVVLIGCSNPPDISGVYRQDRDAGEAFLIRDDGGAYSVTRLILKEGKVDRRIPCPPVSRLGTNRFHIFIDAERSRFFEVRYRDEALVGFFRDMEEETLCRVTLSKGDPEVLDERSGGE